MSLGTMFSSPGKQASQAASASDQAASQVIGQLENYTDTHQQQLRDAIAQQGPNPYFAAAGQLDPQAYYTNPSDTVNFGSGGPGTTSGYTFSQPSPFASSAPPLPKVILSGPTSGQNPTPQQPTQPPPQSGGGNPFTPPTLGGGPRVPRIPIREQL